MSALKQSTAYTRMFLMVQTSDHITGLTGATPTVNISKAGGAFGAAGGTVTEVANGFYKVALTTTDTNTLGDLAYHITAASGDPTDFVDQVTANILGDTLPANVLQWNSSNVAAPATAGVPDVNVKNYNNVAAQTDANSLPKVDIEDISGAAVSTTTAQLGVNVVKFNNVVAGSLPTNFPSLSINSSGAVSIQSNVKKNAALAKFPFTMTDSSTHNPITGKTVTAQVSKDGTGFVSATNVPAEVGNGDYTLDLAAADLNANTVQLRLTATGCDDLNIIVITDP